MKSSEILKEIDNLRLSEKLILVEDIWDSIARANNELPMPDWQKTELAKRYDEYKSGKVTLYDWESVHEEIRKKYT